MRLPVALVLAAAFVTVLEFPIWFAHVVFSDGLGIALLLLRNGLLVAAAVMGARELWRASVTWADVPPLPSQATRSKATSASS
jgi:hypothetical protein